VLPIVSFSLGIYAQIRTLDRTILQLGNKRLPGGSEFPFNNSAMINSPAQGYFPIELMLTSYGIYDVR
jgi:hypothetical protein